MPRESKRPEIDEHDYVAYRKISLSQLEEGAVVKTVNDDGGIVVFEVVEPMYERKPPEVMILECTVPAHGYDVKGKVMRVMHRLALDEATVLTLEEDSYFLRIDTGFVSSLEGIGVPENENEMEAVDILRGNFRDNMRKSAPALITTLREDAQLARWLPISNTNEANNFENDIFSYALDLAEQISQRFAVDISAEEMDEIARVLNKYFYSNYSESHGILVRYDELFVLKNSEGKNVEYHLKAAIALYDKKVNVFKIVRTGS